MKEPLADELHLVVFVNQKSPNTADANLFLGAWGAPPTFERWGGNTLGDIDLGDFDVASPAPVPLSPGLWILEWAWSMTYMEDYGDTAKYGPHPIWRRPYDHELALIVLGQFDVS